MTSALTQPQGPHSEEGGTALPSGILYSSRVGEIEPLSSGSLQTEQRDTAPVPLQGRLTRL